MKLFNILSLIVVLAIGTLQAADPIAVIVTCKTTQPDAKRPDFVALAQNCGQNQLACDQYKNDPFYGPATAVGCEPIFNMAKLQALMKKEFIKGRRFPGSEGSVTLCKTKFEGKTYANIGDTCDDKEQIAGCDKLGKDIAAPVSCATYSSQDWIESEAAKNPVTYGIECQLTGSGVPMRVAVPDCSPNLIKALCDPESGKVLGCKHWDDPLALKKWAEEAPMKAFTQCRLNDKPDKTLNHIPTRDCSPEAQKDACSTWGTPVGCRDIGEISIGALVV